MTEDRVDLAITGAHLWREDAPRDLFVKDGRFVPAPSGGTGAAERTIDAAGRLCVAGFLEPHIHLDKAQINDDVRPNRSGTLDEAIEIIWARKRAYTVEEITARAMGPSARPSPAGSRASAAMSMWTASAASARWKACSKRASAPATLPTFRSSPFRRKASSRTRVPTS